MSPTKFLELQKYLNDALNTTNYVIHSNDKSILIEFDRVPTSIINKMCKGFNVELLHIVEFTCNGIPVMNTAIILD